MTYLFYRWEAGAPSPGPDDVPPGVSASIWRPGSDGFPARGRLGTNLAWWLFTRLGLFSRPDFAEVSLLRDGQVVHRLIVTPKWYRFPDMAAGDLQLGDLWTAPEARGQGLARAAIALTHHHLAGRVDRIWYVVAADNAASIRLIEGCGYRLVGRGIRTRPLGVGALGRFRITVPARSG